MRRHGTTAAVALAALSLAAVPGTASAAKAPALVAGASDGGAASFRLEGRQLTVRLRAPLSGLPRNGARVPVRCGDLSGAPMTRFDLLNTTPPFADAPMRGRPLVRRGQRVVSVRFRRDLAARVNHCDLLPPGSRSSEHDGFVTRMTLRRGPAPACQTGAFEEVVTTSPRVLVTSVKDVNREPDSGFNYRACLRPSGRTQELMQAWSGRHSLNMPNVFAIADTWIAWGVRGDYLTNDVREAWVEARNLAATGSAPRRLRFHYRNDHLKGDLSVRQLAVTADGTVAFTLRTQDRRDGGVRTETRVEAGRPGGTSVTLATVPADSVTDLGISLDGRTVSWREDGVARSATLP